MICNNNDDIVGFDELERNADKEDNPIAEEVMEKEEVFKDFAEDDGEDFDEEDDFDDFEDNEEEGGEF